MIDIQKLLADTIAKQQSCTHPNLMTVWTKGDPKKVCNNCFYSRPLTEEEKEAFFNQGKNA